nr:MAG TPA: hypothetical protein [Caudoviricetes sp.]
MAYTAPTIKDRVAAGDNKYTMQTLSDGRVLLTPSPDEVEEAGTEINKVLLQPLFNLAASHDTAIEKMLADLGILAPYKDYWWRIRSSSGAYVLRTAAAGSIGGAYWTPTSSNSRVDILRSLSATTGNPASNGVTTLQYASSISVDSSGNISLVNPTSLTVSASTIQSYASTINGKYVKNLFTNDTLIYKINTASITTHTERWGVGASGETEIRTYYGYELASLASTTVEVAVAQYSSTSSDYTYVHNSDPNFYPHSGTTAGTEYQYLGKIHDVAAADAPFSLKTVNITSASWGGNKQYTVTTKCKRYLLWGGETTSVYGSAVLVDGTKGYGVRAYYGATGYDRYASILVGAATVPVGSATVTFTSTGFRLSHSESTGPALTLAYLPLA